MYNTGTNFYTSIVHNTTFVLYQYYDRQVQVIYIDNRQYFICTNTFTVNGYDINWNNTEKQTHGMTVVFSAILK